MQVPYVGQTISHLRRTHEVLRVLVRHGFADIAQELGLEELVRRGRRTLRLGTPDRAIAGLPRPVRLRMAMEELGPTFVKLAQVLSTRPDLVPSEWAEEFARLQSMATPVPGAEVLAFVKDELGDAYHELFESVDTEPLAAASVAQVHRAKRRDGREVVLKVLRPGVRETLHQDMQLLEFLAHFIESHVSDLGYSPTATVREFARELARETDLGFEALNTERLAEAFEGDPGVCFPEAFKDASTSSVLCLEYIDGILLSARTDDDLSADELVEVVKVGTRAVFRQCLELGFFHADPHPGNLIVQRASGEIPLRIFMVDCGMVGRIDPRTRERLGDLAYGTLTGDLERVVDAVIDLTDADPIQAFDRPLRADIWELVSHFENASLSELRVGALFTELFDKLRKNRLNCPADIVFLIKAITTIEGVAEALLPDFKIVDEVRPYVERFMKSRFGIRALRRRLTDSLSGYAEFAESLPRDVRLLMASVRKRKLTINLEHRGLDRVTRSVEHASRNISRALVFLGLALSSALLVLADRAGGSEPGALSYLAGAGFLTALVLLAAMATIGRSR